MNKPSFEGWATKYNIKCSDGRTIQSGAFAHNDGKIVPLVYNHQHSDMMSIIGNATLQHRDEGVYAIGYFNESEKGKHAKMLVANGDLTAMSIYANQLKHGGFDGKHVSFGDIRELSLVLAGANPGAVITDIIQHSDGEITYLPSDEAVIMIGEVLTHMDVDEKNEVIEHAEKKEMTVQEVIDTMNEDQQTVMYALIAEALATGEDNAKKETKKKDTNKEDDEEMKQNVFDTDERDTRNYISHTDQKTIIADAKSSRCGTLSAALAEHGKTITDINVLIHGNAKMSDTLEHGITNIGYLFPDAKNYTTKPTFIKRDMEWVSSVMSGTKKTPFANVKTMFADIREEEARAKGYIKGTEKAEEFFTLIKRTTSPTTIYKKQKLDRDDILDITDFDPIPWMQDEMRIMLNEEVARAILIGDGRSGSDDHKVNELNIRPIWKDEDLFTIKKDIGVTTEATLKERVNAIQEAALRARKDYKGSGRPAFFTTEDVLTDCLLLKDEMGRVIYDTEEKLRTALRVSAIHTVPVMENQKRTVGSKEMQLLGIIVNLNDYNIGTNSGAGVTMFDHFDIDFNQQKYLIETRFSGALVQPYSAIALEAEIPAEEPPVQG